MLLDRRERRPVLLANARIVDPSRDLDFPGDLLIVDGTIREAKRGIGAAGVPEGTDDPLEYPKNRTSSPRTPEFPEHEPTNKGSRRPPGTLERGGDYKFTPTPNRTARGCW